MLEHFEFRALPQKEKAQYIWDNGSFLASRMEGFYLINLYHVHNFFAEVWYDTEQSQLTKIRAFISYVCLDVYAEQIEITI